MSETFHDFPFSVDTCHYLPNATNKNKQSQNITYCAAGISHKMLHSVLSAQISFPFTSFSSSIKINHNIFLTSVKFLFLLTAKILLIFVTHH